MTAWTRDVYNNENMRKKWKKHIWSIFMLQGCSESSLFLTQHCMQKKDMYDYSSNFYTYLRNKNKYIPILLIE